MTPSSISSTVTDELNPNGIAHQQQQSSLTSISPIKQLEQTPTNGYHQTAPADTKAKQFTDDSDQYAGEEEEPQYTHLGSSFLPGTYGGLIQPTVAMQMLMMEACHST